MADETDWLKLFEDVWEESNPSEPTINRWICVCSSKELLARGCVCGAITKKTWDEKLKEIEKKKREED